MGPHTLLDEGIAPALDLIQESAGINALLTYSHAFHADLRKPERFLAPDHGKPPRGERSPLPAVWVRHHEQYFVSREYEEMRVPNLRAVGRAVRELSRRA